MSYIRDDKGDVLKDERAEEKRRQDLKKMGLNRGAWPGGDVTPSGYDRC